MMFSQAVEMKKVNLVMMDSDAQRAAIALARIVILHPFEDLHNSLQMLEFPANSFYEAYHSLQSRLAKITEFLPEPLHSPDDLTQLVTVEQLQQMDEQVKDLWVLVSKVQEKLRKENEQLTATRQLSNSLQKFASLDLDLSRLKKSSRFLKIIVGTIPTANYSQLKRALSLAEFMINPFYSGNGQEHVVIMGSSQQQVDVHELLKSADFRELDIPEEFSGNPAQLKQSLVESLLRSQQKIESIQLELSTLLKEIKPTLQKSYNLLVLSKPYADLSTVLKGQGGLVSMLGWVPADSEQLIKDALNNELQYPFYIKLSSPQISEYDSVPSLIRHNWLLRPFQKLVSNFGLPGYAEVDPTVLFFLSYTLMFGMMFGDIGHGAVIALGGLFFWRKKMAVTIITFFLGMSSICFGYIYGSVFGYEHVIHPLWMSPMDDPVLVLLIALAWGALFLIISNLLAIRNYLIVKLYQQAFYSGKGLAGLLFYLGALYSAYQLMSNDQFGWLETVCLVLPLSIIVYFQWKQSQASLFERILVVFIESLEFIISSVSGTLSFLRVAAFSLNHIALSAAVFSIAAMMDTTGHFIAVLLGNIFIIALEGAIVAIQCLRLEYYEGFSRFYSGKGKVFEPLKLDL